MQKKTFSILIISLSVFVVLWIMVFVFVYTYQAEFSKSIILQENGITKDSFNVEDLSLTPGDKVTVTITMSHNSNVATKYRTVIQADSTSLSVLKISRTVNGGTSVPYTVTTADTVISPWTTLALVNAETLVETIVLDIELPADAGNTYQNKTLKLAIFIEAVQGNTDTAA